MDRREQKWLVKSALFLVGSVVCVSWQETLFRGTEDWFRGAPGPIYRDSMLKFNLEFGFCFNPPAVTLSLRVTGIKLNS